MGNCPTNRGICPIWVIVLKGRYPKGVVVLVGNWQRGSCPTGVIFLRGSCPQGSLSCGIVVPRIVVHRAVFS